MEGGVYVKNLLFDKTGHLDKISLAKLKQGSLGDVELSLALEHICNCEECSDVFANSYNDNELAEAPLDFHNEIKERIKKKRESDIKLFFYSFRVAVAAGIALVFVFSSTLSFVANKRINLGSINSPNLSVVSTINTRLTNFSTKIVNLEVFSNEKEKK